ncbi:MAG: 3' terminal RNA ribose 2'-O-methyltransferase Hen1 [Planctomycetes bacterium]|nr:3' terminal RNA ribose 2'-O-methyltransferase Hen1 [Planctomycetota bacterium]
MLLTITTTIRPATDLGFLLHKNPARTQSHELSFGKVHVFYPEATEERCTAAMLLDIDPIGLVRGRKDSHGSDGLLAQYVNDRPFVASSFLSVAIAQVFGSALGGRSKERESLAATPIPLTATLTALPCRGDERLLKELFEPLGWRVRATGRLLDAKMPEWGASPYFDVELTGTKRLSELLSHLYVLVPVLDGDKHYWVAEDEIEKLLRHAGAWLNTHPRREWITHRYLRHQRQLTALALSRLADDGDPDEVALEHASEEAAIERPLSLQERRMDAVLERLREAGARSVVDLGCGEGKFIARLLQERRFERIVGVDVSRSVLSRAKERLGLDRAHSAVAARVELLQGSLTYRDARLSGFDAAVAIEVVEHLDPHRLAMFARNSFAFVGAPVTIVTTPNAEYNSRFEGLARGRLRHRDHRFEWTRAEFRAWAESEARRYARSVEFHAIGDEDPELGPPTQMAVFTSMEKRT